MIRQLLIVGFGGMMGSMLRYLTTVTFKSGTFPYATLLVNVLGSFVIGLIAGLVLKQIISTDLRLFLVTGICGGFTTFSAFSIESLQLINQNKYGLALLYIILSLSLGLTATFIGWTLTK